MNSRPDFCNVLGFNKLMQIATGLLQIKESIFSQNRAGLSQTTIKSITCNVINNDTLWSY